MNPPRASAAVKSISLVSGVTDRRDDRQQRRKFVGVGRPAHHANQLRGSGYGEHALTVRSNTPPCSRTYAVRVNHPAVPTGTRTACGRQLHTAPVQASTPTATATVTVSTAIGSITTRSRSHPARLPGAHQSTRHARRRCRTRPRTAGRLQLFPPASTRRSAERRPHRRPHAVPHPHPVNDPFRRQATPGMVEAKSGAHCPARGRWLPVQVEVGSSR